MDTTILIGYMAGTLTTISFLPQVIRSWKTKSTHDISFAMLSLFGLGMLLWATYGFWIESPPIILANVITFGLIIILLAMKIRYQ